ncbi:MAG: hypothetical protein ABSD85_08425 [Acidimicrobiales bacterium]
MSERPGGYAPNHRKVRRQEELLWLRAQGFTRVVSLLGSTHNLHAYEELGLEWSRFPMPAASETHFVLARLYPSLHGWLRSGERLLLHQEELGDCVMGVAAGYLLWSEILPDGPRAITAMEQLLRRQMGTVGRMIVAAVDDVPSVRTVANDRGRAEVLEPDTAEGGSAEALGDDGRETEDEPGERDTTAATGNAPAKLERIAYGPGGAEPATDRDEGPDAESGPPQEEVAAEPRHAEPEPGGPVAAGTETAHVPGGDGLAAGAS